jgi:hypothetical protein
LVRAPIKDYEIGIYCISTKHAVLRRKCKDWLARNQDNVSEWRYSGIRDSSDEYQTSKKYEIAAKIKKTRPFFISIPWREQVNFQGNDNELRFVLDQH